MDGITLSGPASIQSCAATNWQWKGGEAPYSLQVQTTSNSIDVLLRFSNILDTNFTSTLNFPAGAALSSIVSDSNNRTSSRQNLTIEDNGDHTCYAPSSSSSTQTTQKGYGNLVNGEIPSCQPVSLAEQGSAPYSLSLRTLELPVETYLNYSAIPQSFLTISLPFASGTQYQILFQNSSDPSIIAGPGALNVSSGGSTNCLLLDRPASNSSPSPNSSTNSSRSSHPNVGAIVGGAVGGTVVLLLMVACVFLFLLRRRKRARSQPKTESTNTSQLDPFPPTVTTAATPNSPSSYPSISSSTNINGGGSGSGIERFRNPFKPPIPSSTPTSSAPAPTSGSPATIYSSEPSIDTQTPIYHHDAGRVEIPPSYNEAGSNRRAVLQIE